MLKHAFKQWKNMAFLINIIFFLLLLNFMENRLYQTQFVKERLPKQ